MRNYINLTRNFISFKDYLETFGNVDIFISTWDQQNTTNSWSAAHGDIDKLTVTNSINKKDLSTNFNIQESHININNYSFFDSIYSPLKYTLFTSIKYNWDSRGVHNNIVHSTKMLFLIYQANVLKLYQEFTQGYRYDLVIRTRPDILYNLDICKKIPFNDINLNTLYITYKPECLGLHDDRFAFGSSEIMDLYSSTFYRVSTVNDNNLFGDPETVLYSALKPLLSNVNIIYIPKPGLLVSEKNNTLR